MFQGSRSLFANWRTTILRFGGPELLIVLGIVVLLFGVGRIGKIAGELGSGLRAFRDNLKGDEKPEKDTP